MRLLDPLAGYRLAYGNHLLHAGYFIAIFLIQKEESCNWRYSICRLYMLISHLCVVVFQVLGYFAAKYHFEFFAWFFDNCSMLLYQAGIFWVQTQFFNTDITCRHAMPKLTQWLIIEIFTFYGLIISAMIYLFNSSMCNFKRHNFLPKVAKHI